MSWAAVRESLHRSAESWQNLRPVFDQVDYLIDLQLTSRGKKSRKGYPNYRCHGTAYDLWLNSTVAAPPPLAQMRLPPSARILFYGNSWMFQLYLEVLRYNAAMFEPVVEGAPLDECRSIDRQSFASKAPYREIRFVSLNTTITPVTNCWSLQSPELAANLSRFLSAGRFTHALVMEPHAECYQRWLRDGGRMCLNPKASTVPRIQWATTFWATFDRWAAETAAQLLEVVAWFRPAGEGAFHTPVPADAERLDPSVLSYSYHTGALARLYPCTWPVCKAWTSRPRDWHECLPGTPTLMVAEVLQWLRLHGRVQVASKNAREKGTMVRRHFRRDAN